MPNSASLAAANPLASLLASSLLPDLAAPTSEPRYREWGWKMFLAFEKHCKVARGGYVGLRNVGLENSPKDDKMETFWLAESLKYFLLLFSDDDLLNLETHVLNTEAHPLLIWPAAG